jgi:hypothetical protein
VTCPNGAEVAGIRRAVTDVGEIRVFGVFDYCVVVAADHKYRTRSFLVGAYNSAIEKDSVAVRPACGGGRPAASEPGVGGTPGTRSCSLLLSSDRNGWHVLGMLFRFGSIRLGRIPPAVDPVKIGIVVLRHAVLN